ncbi:hypothetical protein Trydic_g16219 [Trypoxylus dichotomus]
MHYTLILFNSVVRRFGDLRKKKVQLLTNLAFLFRCRDQKVTPKYLQSKRNIGGAKAARIYKRAEEALLREQIQSTRRRLDQNANTLYRLHLQLAATFSYHDGQKVDTITENTAENLNKHLVEKKNAKFQRIDNTKQYKLDPSRTVVNLTDEILPPEVISIFEKGGNFSVTPKSIPKEGIIANRGSRNQTPAYDRGRRGSFRQWKALKQLKQDKSLTIIQADTGNTTVIIDTEEYKQKIKMLLEPPTYVTCHRNPTSSVLRETKRLVKVSSLPDDMKEQVIVTEALPPRLYGLPKIHKWDVPFRPIVSAPTYLLPKHFTTLLQSYIDGKASYIRDSVHFVEKLQKV